MSDPYFESEKALIDAGKSAVTTVLGSVPLDLPNVPLGDKPDGFWCALVNVRSDTVGVTVGQGGEDEITGFLQIDVNYPQGKGSGKVLKRAGAIAVLFPPGRSMVYGGQEVTVKSTTVSGGRFVGGFYRLSVTINYYTRYHRAIL